MPKTLIAENLVKSYSGRKVVDNVSFSLQAGEAVALLGPNGAGKTTSFDMVVGLVQPDQGDIYLSESETHRTKLTGLKIHSRSRMGIGYLTQEASAFRQLSVRDNLALVLEQLGLGKEAIRERSRELLEEFGIFHLKDSDAISLSGGERRRLEITRVLASNPDFVLLDEPFTGIDPIAIEDIQKVVKKLAQDKGLGILITDHNPRATLNIVDRAYIIQDGKIIRHGSSEEIAKDEMVKKYYLGQDFSLR